MRNTESISSQTVAVKIGKRYNNRIKVLKVILYIFLILLSVVSVIPFVMMIVNATRSNGEILRGFTLIPGQSFLENYNVLISYMDVWRGFANSLFVATCVTVLNAYFSALTAFAMAFYEFKGKNLIFGAFLVIMMVPGQLGLLGQYELNSTLGILDTYWPLIIPSIAAPFTVFFFRQYLVSSMQVSILEAARIDGATELYMFHKIVLPILKPAIATQAIFTFIGTWNNYMTPLIMLRTPSKFTLPVMMGALNGSPVAMNLGAMYLGIAISVVPIMLAFMFFSKNIINSISAGAVK
ncbi:carbohydrate ABC transporter permease [Jeotgalibaca sp. A122]|uniref:carbohydrate ABC transporter permease n=1 Tax=Jeotgalibaca sp. A122 TaxID=3457322 RepID=UPI003FD3BF20